MLLNESNILRFEYSFYDRKSNILNIRTHAQPYYYRATKFGSKSFYECVEWYDLFSPPTTN